MYCARTSLSLLALLPKENMTLSSEEKFSPRIDTANSLGLCSFMSRMGNGDTEVTIAVFGFQRRKSVSESRPGGRGRPVERSVTSNGRGSSNFSSLPFTQKLALH